MAAAAVSRKAGPIVAQLRASHPVTPIVLAEGTPHGTGWFYPTHREAGVNAALRAVFESPTAHDRNLHHVRAADLFAGTGPLVNPTVGGCHPSDLGARDVADFYTKFLRSSHRPSWRSDDWLAASRAAICDAWHCRGHEEP
jgi:hypothetical protein